MTTAIATALTPLVYVEEYRYMDFPPTYGVVTSVNGFQGWVAADGLGSLEDALSVALPLAKALLKRELRSLDSEVRGAKASTDWSRPEHLENSLERLAEKRETLLSRSPRKRSDFVVKVKGG